MNCGIRETRPIVCLVNCGIGESFYENIALSIRMLYCDSEQTNWRTMRCLKYLLKYFPSLMFFYIVLYGAYLLTFYKIHLEMYLEMY